MSSGLRNLAIVISREYRLAFLAASIQLRKQCVVRKVDNDDIPIIKCDRLDAVCRERQATSPFVESYEARFRRYQSRAIYFAFVTYYR